MFAATTSEEMIADTGRRWCSRGIPLLPVFPAVLSLVCWCPTTTEFGLGGSWPFLEVLEWPTSDEARFKAKL